jgi:quercetin dioxygenase-like cupin family protein
MKFRLVCGLLLAICFDAWALDPAPGVRVTPLLKETTSWDGKPIVYPQGEAQVTSLFIEIAPGAETGLHYHPVPSFAYVLEGTLEVTADDGRVKRLHAGDALAEVVNRPHNGRNVGTVPVRLVVFYTGAVGSQLTVKQEK